MTIEAKATLDLQPYQIADLRKYFHEPARIDAQSLGWLPVQAWTRRHERRQTAAVTNNGQLVGLAMWGVILWQMRIYQTWVQPDARLILHGRALVDHLTAEARQLNLPEIGLWCRQDLAANQFWRALGFNAAGWRNGRRGTRHNQWVLNIRANPLGNVTREDVPTQSRS